MESIEEYRGISATKSHFVSSISKASWNCCEIPEGLSRAFLHPSLLCTTLKDIIALLTAKMVHFAWIIGQMITSSADLHFSSWAWSLTAKMVWLDGLLLLLPKWKHTYLIYFSICFEITSYVENHFFFNPSGTMITFAYVYLVSQFFSNRNIFARLPYYRHTLHTQKGIPRREGI